MECLFSYAGLIIDLPLGPCGPVGPATPLVPGYPLLPLFPLRPGSPEAKKLDVIYQTREGVFHQISKN